MKTVAVDCRFASYNAGLGRYTRELVGALLRRDDPWEYVLLVKDENEAWIKDLPKTPKLLAAPYDHYSLAEQTKLPGIIRDAKADLLFSPHFNAPLRSPVPYLITVHDLILHHFPNRASMFKQAAYRFLMKRAVSGSHAVLTVSTFVADELRKTYADVVTDKLHVTFEGVSPHFTPKSENETKAVRAKYDLKNSFFLYVGNAKQHKNVKMLLRAFEQAGADADLVLVSGGSEAKALALPSRVKLLQDVSETDLPALYSAASSFVTASLYEGFCLPAAEALACGCPVIAADRGPLREVTGGHAMLIEPTETTFADAFCNPPADRTMRLLWDWNLAAERTATVLHGALGN